MENEALYFFWRWGALDGLGRHVMNGRSGG
jgi:hypothetical protein